RPVMESLGFSTDALLVKARSLNSNGIYMLPSESKDNGHRRREVEVKPTLAAKVEDARILGLHSEEVVRLKQLLAKFVDAFRTDPMPNLDTAMVVLVGTSVHFTLDWTNGGQTEAVSFCQSAPHQMFGELLFRGLLAWLDDLLGAATTPNESVRLLEHVLEICASLELKLHPKKCAFFLQEAEWCGKVISSVGSRRRLPTSSSSYVRPTGCGRASHSQLIDPLRRLLEVGTKLSRSAKKSALAKIPVSAMGHPRQDMAVCLFTDASEGFCGTVATQVLPEDLEFALAYCVKEAFAVVEACKCLDYLVIHPDGFRLFTDHRNPVYIFTPPGQSPNMAKYQSDKLQRWALVVSMSTFPCTIESVFTPTPQGFRMTDGPVGPQISEESTPSRRPTTWNDDMKFYVTPNDEIWVPYHDLDLEKWFRVSPLHLCGWDMVPRPLGSALHAECPNELIHVDWLSLPKSDEGLKHVLVVKDDLSGFVRLFPSRTADATATAAALMDWFTTFGIVTTWVSDDEMLRDVSGRSEKLRGQAKKQGVKWTNVDVGDYVLVGLKLYSEAANGTAEDLMDQAAYGDGGFHVEDLLAAPVVNGQHTILVKWLSLENEEASWEPALNL
ncbi:hypothetical protein H310_06555, partial [Aphanomyces invadans]